MIRKTLAIAVAIGAVLGLAGCSGSSPVPAPKTPRQAVFEAEVAYASVQALALRYVNLPRCGSAAAAGIKISCSDAGIVAEIRKVDADAVAAIDSAVDTAKKTDATDTAVTIALKGVGDLTTALRQILANHGITEASLGTR